MAQIPDKPAALTEAQKKQLRNRNLVVALALLALCALFFLTTIVRLGGNVAERAL